MEYYLIYVHLDNRIVNNCNFLLTIISKGLPVMQINYLSYKTLHVTKTSNMVYCEFLKSYILIFASYVVFK